MTYICIGLAFVFCIPLGAAENVLSCVHQVAAKDASCVELIKPGVEESRYFSETCEKSHGVVKNSLCELRDAVGVCKVREASDQEISYLHYEPNVTGQKISQIKHSCLLADGKWEDFDLHEALKGELLETQTKEKKDLEQSNLIFDYLNKAVTRIQEAVTSTAQYLLPRGKWEEWVRSKQRTLAKEDPRWLNVSIFRSLWQEIYWHGGCGTLSTLACAKNLGLQTRFSAVQSEYNSPSTDTFVRGEYFLKRGFCFHPEQVLENKCSAYKTLSEELERNHEVSIIMVPVKGNGHIEHLVRAHVENEKECFGITNSWGSPAVVMGGDLNFFHSRFSQFVGLMSVRYETVSHCSEEFCSGWKCGENFEIEKTLGFPNSLEKSRNKIKEYVDFSEEMNQHFTWAALRRMDQILYGDTNTENILLAVTLIERSFKSETAPEVSQAIFRLVKHPELKNSLYKHKPDLLKAIEEHHPKDAADPIDADISRLLNFYFRSKKDSFSEALVEAVKNDDFKMVKRLMNDGLEVSYSSLKIAVEQKKAQMVELLLSHPLDADPKIVKSLYGILVGVAIANDDLKVVKLLLEKGAVPPRDSLKAAVEKADIELIQILLAREAESRVSVVLELAIEKGNPNFVRRLLKAGFKATSENLKQAVISKNIEIVRTLLLHNTKDENGDALWWSMHENSVEIASLLMDSGSVPKEEYALWLQVYNNNLELVRVMLAHGLRDTDLRSLNAAVDKGNLSMVELLLEYGSKPSDWTLRLAKMNGNLEIIKALERGGLAN